MSQGLHQGILSFTTNGFDRSTPHHRHQEEQQRRQQQHLAQQSRRDKLRVQQQGFEPPPSLPLVAIEEEVEQQDHGELPAVYETAGTMWSEMFNFSAGGGAFGAAAPTEAVAPVPVVVGEEWYGGNRSQGIVGGLGPLGDSKHSPNNTADINRDSIGHQNHHQISSLNAESAAAMQLFLMNPQPRSPSPPPSTTTTSSTPLHLLLSNQSTTTTSSNPPLHQAVYHHSAARAPFSTTQIPFTVVPSSSGTGAGDVDIVDNAAIQLNSSSKIGGVVEGQGLSLTLSSSLQHLEAAKAASHEEFKMGEDGMLYYGSRAGGGGVASSHSYQLKNLGDHQHYQSLQLQGIMGQNVHEHIDFRSSSSGLGMVSLLRNSRYVKAARELLEEFCSVGRADHLKNNRLGRHNNTDLSSDQIGGGGAGGGGSSSSSKGLPPLSAADRIDYQRKKTKLLSMLDEVGRRYNHYCEQLRTVVSSFDSVMGFGAATPYTGLAQKAMSRHFRCLKDAIIAQLKLTCELLGEKDSTGGSGVTKGETPRLRLLDQSLRQQRAFHQMGMMEQEAWRPQRGLPERSVNILRAWLFEHFLHPYPSDADKHFLSRQTGLSRNQVSNWFINARVRLWKPMVEEMYQKEAKEEGEVVEEGEGEEEEEEERRDGQSNSSTRTPTPREPVTTVSATTATSTTSLISSKRTEINATESDPSHLHAINRQYFSENQATTSTAAANLNVIAATTARPNYRHEVGSPVTLEAGNVQYHHQQQQQHRMAAVDVVDLDDTCLHGSVVAAEYRTTVAAAAATGLPNPNSNCSTLVNFRTTATTTATGDVSLTLGLRHAGNLPEKNRFSLTDFGGC